MSYFTKKNFLIQNILHLVFCRLSKPQLKCHVSRWRLNYDLTNLSRFLLILIGLSPEKCRIHKFEKKFWKQEIDIVRSFVLATWRLWRTSSSLPTDEVFSWPFMARSHSCTALFVLAKCRSNAKHVFQQFFKIWSLVEFRIPTCTLTIYTLRKLLIIIE